MTDPDFSTAPLDVVVIGAGVAGMYAMHRLREQGLRVHGFEAGSGVGGTWYFNRYPGARCDVESFDYSYSFSEDLQQDWDWSEKYAAQPEILSYLDHVADRFDLRSGFTFDTRVLSAQFDEDSSTWRVHTDGGHDVTSRFVVCATGSLSTANVPNIAGRETFGGEVFHTGFWPHEGVDFTRQASGSDRHRIVGHPVRSVDRRAGRSPLRVPAVRELQCAGGKHASR